MTQEQINYYKAAASLGLIPDEENVIFIFSSTHKDLLLDILNGKLDVIQLAHMEMRNRGLDVKTGKWIGWPKNTNQDVL